MSDVTRMTATQIAGLIRSGEVSAVEVATAHLDRIAQVDERVHAFLHVDRERALERARLVDQKVITGPLAGVPIAVKDVIATRGVPTTAASKILEGWKPPYDATTVERLQEGEVSPYLFDVIEPGEELEMRGPIGLYFVWEAVMSEPLLMIAGGSGVVPFRAMLRHRRAVGADVPARLLYSARTIADVIYRDELEVHDGSDETEVVLTLTREQPDGWGGYDRRVDRTRPGPQCSGEEILQ